MRVRFDNPGGKLAMVAFEEDSSRAPSMIPRREGGTTGVASVLMTPGETWTFAVAARKDEPAPTENRTYSIQLGRVGRGAGLGRIEETPGTRFDVSGNMLVVAAWSSLRVFVREGGQLTEVAQIPMTSAADVVLDHDFAYVADFNEGLKIYNLEDPASPVLVETVLDFVEETMKVMGQDFSVTIDDTGVIDVYDESENE